MTLCARHYPHRAGRDGATVQQHESKSCSNEDPQSRSTSTRRTSQMVFFRLFLALVGQHIPPFTVPFAFMSSKNQERLCMDQVLL